MTPEHLAVIAAITLRRLARDLRGAAEHPSIQDVATIAESRREAVAALRGLSDELPEGYEKTRARIQAGAIERGAHDAEWIASIAVQWEAWALK